MVIKMKKKIEGYISNQEITIGCSDLRSPTEFSTLIHTNLLAYGDMVQAISHCRKGCGATWIHNEAHSASQRERRRRCHYLSWVHLYDCFETQQLHFHGIPQLFSWPRSIAIRNDYINLHQKQSRQMFQYILGSLPISSMTSHLHLTNCCWLETWTFTLTIPPVHRQNWSSTFSPQQSPTVCCSGNTPDRSWCHPRCYYNETWWAAYCR